MHDFGLLSFVLFHLYIKPCIIWSSRLLIIGVLNRVWRIHAVWRCSKVPWKISVLPLEMFFFMALHCNCRKWEVSLWPQWHLCPAVPIALQFRWLNCTLLVHPLQFIHAHRAKGHCKNYTSLKRRHYFLLFLFCTIPV